MSSGISSVARENVLDPPTRFGRGRPPKALTEARLAIILDQVAIGVPPQTAAIAAGVPQRTWANWMARSREEDAPEPYRGISDRIESAVAFYHQSRVHVVHRGAEKDHRAAQWELERRFPAEWGDKSKAGVVVNVGVIVESPEWLALRERMLVALAQFPEALLAVGSVLGDGDVVEGEAIEVGELGP